MYTNLSDTVPKSCSVNKATHETLRVPTSVYTVHTDYSVTSIRYAVHTAVYSLCTSKYTVRNNDYTLHKCTHTVSTVSHLRALFAGRLEGKGVS